MTITLAFLIIFVCTTILFLLLELNYFLRTLLCVIWAKLCKRKSCILDETTFYGICLTTDIDNMLTHMNNARFMRESDFAKIDFYERTGVYREIKRRGGSLALGATTIRYRKFIKLFQKYCITTKIIYWDDKSLYMEHKFITPYNKFINAIALCKIRLINCNAEEVMEELLKKNAKEGEAGMIEKPLLPPELAKWIESNEISSANLRNSSYEKT